jgi:transcriptional regulator with XRE-family HTH domain
MATLSDRIRERLRAEMAARHLSQRDVAGIAGWSQSRVAKLMTGRVEMGVDDLEGLCFALDLSLTEVVRDPGLEFCADLTPTELRLLEQYRKQSEPMKTAITEILQVRAKGGLPQRYAGSKPTAYKVGKPRGHSSGA